jgi:hypothetical protein
MVYLTRRLRNLGKLVGDKLCITNPDGDYSIPDNSRGAVEIVTTTAYVQLTTLHSKSYHT